MWKWKSVIRYAFLSAVVTSEFPQYRRGHHWEMLCLAWIDARVQQHCDMNSNIHERTAVLGEQCVSDVINCEQVSWCAIDRVNWGENLRTLEFFKCRSLCFCFCSSQNRKYFGLTDDVTKKTTVIQNRMCVTVIQNHRRTANKHIHIRKTYFALNYFARKDLDLFMPELNEHGLC